ncbi:MAG TPA: TlpA family protein disulfide reductase, partial [Stenotrophomonas sp.]|nr:TlpA family protein disulfide reductase [Stenotrophomonas sp.]
MLKRALFPVVALVLAVLVIALSWQNRQLRQINEQMAVQMRQSQLDAHGLALGTRAELLTLRTTL